MLRRVALVKTDVLEELSVSIIRVTRIGELGTLDELATDTRCSVLGNYRVVAQLVASRVVLSFKELVS
jgi:hypothetical protein